MSRTKRSRENRSWADKYHDGKVQKFTRNRSCMGHRVTGKIALGPGGISCDCCIPFKRKEVKVKIRRWERHTTKIKDCLEVSKIEEPVVDKFDEKWTQEFVNDFDPEYDC